MTQDGTCIIHTVRKGNYVRTIRPLANNPQHYSVPSIAMSEEGKIVMYARTKKEAPEVNIAIMLVKSERERVMRSSLDT